MECALDEKVRYDILKNDERRSGGMADAWDLKSPARKSVPVQVRSSAPKTVPDSMQEQFFNWALHNLENYNMIFNESILSYQKYML